MDIFEKVASTLAIASIGITIVMLIVVTVLMITIGQFLPGFVLLVITLLVGGLWCCFLNIIFDKNSRREERFK